MLPFRVFPGSVCVPTVQLLSCNKTSSCCVAYYFHVQSIALAFELEIENDRRPWFPEGSILLVTKDLVIR